MSSPALAFATQSPAGAPTPTPVLSALSPFLNTQYSQLQGQGQQPVQRALQGSRGAPSAAGSAGSSTATSGNALNEARRTIRAILQPEGQGRLSLIRIASELEAVKADINNAFTSSTTYDPSLRLLDLLASLHELQLALTKTGLGALPAGQTDFTTLQPLGVSMTQEVQEAFKARQRVREGAGIVKSAWK